VSERLYRSRDERMLTGVAGGVAEMLDADPSLIRVVWALLVFLTGGLALVAYVVMAIVVPERPAGMPVRPAGGSAAGSNPSGAIPDGSGWVDPAGSASRMSGSSAAPREGHDHSARARGGLVIGLVLIVVGGAFLFRQFFDLAFWWPVAAIGLGVVLVVAAITPSRRSG